MITGLIAATGPLVWAVSAAAAQSPPPPKLVACRRPDLQPRGECGTISVWEDRDARRGRRIDIAFAVLRARQPSGREPVVMFGGGPGQGSTDLAGLANGALAPIRATRDILLVDQRGTGGSNPLACSVDVAGTPSLAFGHVFNPARFRRCRTELEPRADLRLYTTAIAVEDVDDVRRALGYDRVLLWGGSYGTRIAQAYMKAHPDRVVAAVLDGVVPFDFRAPAGYARSAQQSLDRVIADCRADPGCARANPGLEAAFGRLAARFGTGPIDARVRRPDGSTAAIRMSAGDFAYAVRGILYSSADARELPAMIHRADSTGDVSPFAQRYWGRAADFQDFADGLHFAIFCAEDTPFIADSEVPALGRGTFMGTYLLDEYRTVCRDWVRAPIGPRARQPVTAAIPTLLLSGWFDPVTPPETAERVARSLPHSRHLVVRNEAHGAGFGCALPATLHVLERGTLDGLPSVCEGVTNLWGAGGDRRP